MDSENYEAERVQVLNVPLRSVLLTHSRLRDEYLESKDFRQLSASIRINAAVCLIRTTQDGRYTQALAALSRVQHATVYITFPTCYPMHKMLWGRMPVFFDALAVAAPHLDTLQIVVRGPIREADGDVRASMYATPASPPPNALAGLSFVQSGEGSRIGFRGFRRTVQAGAENSGGTDIMTLDVDLVVHSTYKAGIYLYTRDGKERRSFDSGLILKEWPLKDFPKEVLDTLPLQEAEKLARCASEMLEWREMRGAGAGE